MDSFNVVVTGGNGFVGSHLVDLLIEKRVNITCIVRKSSSLKWLRDKQVELVEIGLNDIKAIAKTLVNIDYVFHVAGTVKAKNQEGFDFGNVTLTENVLEAALKAPSIKKIIVTSSLAAVGPSIIGEPHNETVGYKPVSEYGISKMRQELLVKKYLNKLPIIVVRPPVVYGERDVDVLEFFKIVNKGIIPMVGSTPKYLSTIYVKDLVRGMVELAVSEKQGETYFLVGESEMDWQFFGTEIAKVLNKSAKAVKIPSFAIKIAAAFGEVSNMLSSKQAPMNMNKYKETIQDAWTCTSQKANEHIGFQPNYSLNQSLTKTIDWYKQEGSL